MGSVANSTKGFFKLFKTSTGSPNMNLAGANTTSPNTFFVSPSTANAPDGVALERVNIQIVDGSMTPAKLAGLAAHATEGVKIQMQTSTGGLVFDFLDGSVIKTNNQFGLLVGSDNLVNAAAGDDGMTVRWTLDKGYGDAVIMKQAQRLAIIIDTPTSGVTSWTAMAQGKYVDG